MAENAMNNISGIEMGSLVIDDEHREALKKAKTMIKAYESIKKCSNPDFEGYEDKLLSNIKELSK